MTVDGACEVYSGFLTTGERGTALSEDGLVAEGELGEVGEKGTDPDDFGVAGGVVGLAEEDVLTDCGT